MVPPFDSDSDEREKPSWREIDRKRDRSRHVSRDEHSRSEKSSVPLGPKSNTSKKWTSFSREKRAARSIRRRSMPSTTTTAPASLPVR